MTCSEARVIRTVWVEQFSRILPALADLSPLGADEAATPFVLVPLALTEKGGFTAPNAAKAIPNDNITHSV